ncbi:MAG: CPBP family intramembrane metalloprotease [Kofleriaceae bacterium]|nr:CPBP family intramembrane metalloprotease [Kofleriaceae bacterium]MBP9170794.1 CPBP family intramembrane metalloprotease [Kofleriaceae bacterium]MBP9857691.1 CPBP family intramembrane metalloprotease [Kofleriaceae bacterium]
MRRGVGWAGRGDLAASLAAIGPLALAYGVAVALTGQHSAIDLPTRALWAACDGQRAIYLAAYAGLGLAYLAWLARSGRRRAVSLSVLAPLVGEAALYALTLVAVAALLASGVGLGGTAVVAALGAGVHEELGFRLLGVGGGAALAIHLGLGRRAAVVAAVVSSSLAFAAAHHLAGEPWELATFSFRVLAGVGFAAVFWQRSLAHAVYAHVLYDLWVGLVAR